MRGPATLIVFGLFLLRPDDAERLLQEARDLFAIGALEPHGVDEDVAPGRHGDFDGAFHLDTSNREFDRAVPLSLALDHVPAFAGLDRGFVDPVELEQAAKFGAHFLFDMAVPPVGGQAVGAVGGLVQGDVVGAFEPDGLGFRDVEVGALEDQAGLIGAPTIISIIRR